MSYDLHLSTGIGRPQEKQGGAGKKEGLCFLLRHWVLELEEIMRFWDRRRTSAFSDRNLTLRLQSLSANLLQCFFYQWLRSFLSKFRLCLLWTGRTGYSLFSLQHSFGYLLCPSFFLRLINSLRLCLEVIFKDVQDGVFSLFFSVPEELGPENGHSLFTDVCMWV